MTEEGGQTLYTTDDTGNYVEYTPPAPPAFNETLPEDIRENEHLQGVEDSSTLARYYVDLKKDYLAPPETAEGYEFQRPDGMIATDEDIASFKSIAFESGLNQKQFDQIMNHQITAQKQGIEKVTQTINAKRDEFEAQLKAEWGDNYEKNLESANLFLNSEKVADEGFKQFLRDTRFGDNPHVVKFFNKLAGLISEDVLGKPGTGAEGDKVERGEDGRPMLKFPSMDK